MSTDPQSKALELFNSLTAGDRGTAIADYTRNHGGYNIIAKRDHQWLLDEVKRLQGIVADTSYQKATAITTCMTNLLQYSARFDEDTSLEIVAIIGNQLAVLSGRAEKERAEKETDCSTGNIDDKQDVKD